MDPLSQTARRPPADVYLALGLNLPPHGWRWRRLLGALERLSGATLVRATPPQPTAAVGRGVRGRFWNGAAHLRTAAAPRVLLARLQRLERALGRRGRGDRPADVDIVLWHSDGRWRCIAAPALRVPHPRAALRPWVLDPLTALTPPRPLPPRLERAAGRRRRFAVS